MIRAAVAKVWGVPVSKEVDAPMPDCSKCRRPGFEHVRVAWGCDRPAPDAVFRTGCPACHGEGCEDCNQKGYREHFRCPTAVIGEDEIVGYRVRALLEAYRHQDAHGTLPVAGGLLDQAASYVAGCSVIDEERGRWEKIRQEHHERQMRKSKAPMPQPKARR